MESRVKKQGDGFETIKNRQNVCLCLGFLFFFYVSAKSVTEVSRSPEAKLHLTLPSAWVGQDIDHMFIFGWTSPLSLLAR